MVTRSREAIGAIITLNKLNDDKNIKMSMQLKTCIEAAMAGGLVLKERLIGGMKARTKGDRDVGFHAIVTPADFISQETILSVLRKEDPNAYFITEEQVKSPRFIQRLVRPSNLELVRRNGVYIIDELDGSSTYEKGHHEWSISVGYVDRKLVHTAGAIFAPDIRGGTLFFASRGNGSFFAEMERTMIIDSSRNSDEPKIDFRWNVRKAEVSKVSSIKNAYVIVGPDNFLSKYKVHSEALKILGDNTRTMNGTGSCALSLGLVAAGKAEAVVQPVQSPWDWAAGKALVEEAGGVFRFYEMLDGKIIPITNLRLEHYNPDKKAVGFVAGNKAITDWIMDRFLEINRKV